MYFHTRTQINGLFCALRRSSSSTDLLLPVVRQGQVVVSPVGLLVVVHERVQVWKVPVQIDFSGVPSTHQVAVELWTLLTHKMSHLSNRSYCWVTLEQMTVA